MNYQVLTKVIDKNDILDEDHIENESNEPMEVDDSDYESRSNAGRPVGSLKPFEELTNDRKRKRSQKTFDDTWENSF